MTSEGRSHLAGHRRFSERFAEVQEGIERLLARCWSGDDLWDTKTLVPMSPVTPTGGVTCVVSTTHRVAASLCHIALVCILILRGPVPSWF